MDEISRRDFGKGLLGAVVFAGLGNSSSSENTFVVDLPVSERNVGEVILDFFTKKDGSSYSFHSDQVSAILSGEYTEKQIYDSLNFLKTEGLLETSGRGHYELWHLTKKRDCSEF